MISDEPPNASWICRAICRTLELMTPGQPHYGQGFFIGQPMALDDAIHDLPLYACFATSTGPFDPSIGKAAALGG